MASPYTIEPLGRFWSVHHEFYGLIAEDIDSYGDAISWRDQHQEEETERERAEAAVEAEYDAEIAAPARRAA